MLSKLAIAAVAYHSVAFAALHVLEPQVSPTRSLIGDYSPTDSGWLAASTFVAFAVVWAAVALALSGPTQSMVLVAGRVLFAVAAVGLPVAAFVPSAADPRTKSALATALNLTRPGLFVGILLVSIALARLPEWEGASWSLVILAVVAFAVMMLSVRFLLDAGLAGVGQRVVFLLVYAWVLLVALGCMSGQRSPPA